MSTSDFLALAVAVWFGVFALCGIARLLMARPLPSPGLPLSDAVTAPGLGLRCIVFDASKECGGAVAFCRSEADARRVCARLTEAGLPCFDWAFAHQWHDVEQGEVPVSRSWKS